MDEDNSKDDVLGEKSEFSKGGITQEAIKKCITLRSTEMKAGYYNYVFTNGLWNKSWLADSRDSYISSVIALKQLLKAEIGRDDSSKKELETLNKESEELFNTYAYSPYEQKIQDNGQSIYNKNDKIKYMPTMESSVNIPVFDEQRNRNIIKLVKKGWDEYINAYRDGLVIIYDKIFGELNVLVDRFKYFKGEIKHG